MRNIPFQFISEEAIDQINRAQAKRQVIQSLNPAANSLLQRFAAALQRMTEMSGPNSIANLERALRPTQGKRTDP